MPHSLLLPRARAGVVVAGLATAVLAAGCGSSSGGGNSNADPATVVPASTAVYGALVVRPEGGQKAQVEAVLKKVLRTDDPGAKIVKLFDHNNEGLSFEKDVKPWLGKRAALFLSSLRNPSDPELGIVIAANDTSKALDAARKNDKGRQKRSYRGVDYEVNSEKTASAAVGDFLVVGPELAVKQVIDTSKDPGKALSKADDYNKALDEAGRDGLATLYLDPGTLFDSLAQGGSINQSTVVALRQALSTAGVRAVGMGADAQANGFTVTFATIGSKPSSPSGGHGDGPGALAAAPGDSWLGIGIGNLGGLVESALKQFAQAGALGGVDLDQLLEQFKAQSGLDVRKDIIDWMGDASIFVRGTSLGDVGGGVIIDSKDTAATDRGIARIARLLRRQGTPVHAVTGGVSFKISDRFDVFLVRQGKKFVGAVGRSSLDAALSSGQKLGDSPGFQQAASRLGEGLRPSVFFAMQPLLQLLDSAGLGTNSGYQSAKPYLDAFTTIVAGGKRTGDVGKGRIVIGVR